MAVGEETDISEDVIEAISSLGNRHRLEMVLALDKVEQEHQKPRHTMSFSELYEVVSIDSTSQFSYHLNQLIDHFITETPEGYRLTYSGNKIARVILSGMYESAADFHDLSVAGSCIFCAESALIATVEEELFRIRCDACDAILVTDFIPKSQSAGRTVEAIAESYGYRIWSMALQLRGGVCPECFGVVDTNVDVYEQHGSSHPIQVHRCRECKFVITLPIELSVAFHPAVIYWFWKHDLPLLDIPLWEFFDYIVSDVISTEVISDDPISISFEISVENQQLTLVMADTGALSLHSGG